MNDNCEIANTLWTPYSPVPSDCLFGVNSLVTRAQSCSRSTIPFILIPTNSIAQLFAQRYFGILCRQYAVLNNPSEQVEHKQNLFDLRSVRHEYPEGYFANMDRLTSLSGGFLFVLARNLEEMDESEQVT
jgi:hypothetical protein